MHEWLDASGGSEQVFDHIGSVFPQAERWALWAEPPWTENVRLQQSWLSRTPLKGRKAAALPVMPLVWRTLPKRSYDTVVSSSHCLAHTVKFRSTRDTRYLSYVYSPMRYAWSPELDSRASSGLATPARRLLQQVDVRMSKHVDSYATLSYEVQARLREFWNRDSVVIYPHVDTDFFQAVDGDAGPTPEYLLGAGRWIPYKRFDLILRVAERAGLPVVLAGGGPEEGRLRGQAAMMSVPVHFVRYPTRERLRELYSAALALLFPVHEDFGLVPLEAMACGTPVVGINRGGLLETVTEGVSGVLVDADDESCLARAVHQVHGFDPRATRECSLRFGGTRFKEEIGAWVTGQARSGPLT